MIKQLLAALQTYYKIQGSAAFKPIATSIYFVWSCVVANHDGQRFLLKIPLICCTLFKSGFMKIDFKKMLPHIIAVLVFLIVAVVFCKPAIEGKVVYQHDLQGWRGMVQQSVEFKETYGHYPLWTNSLFSGMPAFQIAMDATHSLSMGYFEKVISLGLPQPINFFFLHAFVCIFCALYYASIHGLAY